VTPPRASARRGFVALSALAAALIPAAALAVSASPNDPYFPVQWALHGSAASTSANQAWCASTGNGVVVADIDTGVDFGHPDLGSALVAGAAFTSGNANPGTPSSPGTPNPDATGENAVTDDYGHGTMTTGIVVAATGNGTGIAGEAPGARALVMKVFSNKGGTSGYSAYTSDVESAIVWSVQHGARVINLSLGPSVPLVSTALGDQMPGFVQWASQHGAAVAIAAGNTYIPAADYLGISKYALVVGALGPSGAVASYSQHGVGVNIYAPGGDGPGGHPGSDVISTFPTYPLPQANQPLSPNVAPGYAAYDGTSFATPYTAGVLALLMARGYSADEARSRVVQVARTVGGNPVVDAPAAVGACTAGSAGGGGGSGGGAGAAQLGHASATQPPRAVTTLGVSATAQPSQNAVRPEGSGGDLAGQAPSTGASPGGGHPNALLLASLGLLIVLGGPALMAVRRRLRRA
jgi:subtilisin family serine protease